MLNSIINVNIILHNDASLDEGGYPRGWYAKECSKRGPIGTQATLSRKDLWA
jgi:hypothetical protein